MLAVVAGENNKYDWGLLEPSKSGREGSQLKAALSWISNINLTWLDPALRSLFRGASCRSDNENPTDWAKEL